MIERFPTYYKKFKCIADKCTDTCCVGWQVVIDEDTADFYKNFSGAFGDKLRSRMITDEEGDIVFINEKGKCPFLNCNNLCDIFINAGEEHLSHTCTMFPRFYETFGGTREMGLSLSCPVANELILSDTEFAFENDFTDEMPEFNDINADLYMCLKNEREKLLTFVQSNAEMSQKLKSLLDYVHKINTHLENEEYEKINKLELDINASNELVIDNSIFSKLEYLTSKGKEVFTANMVFNEEYSEKYINLLVYYIYRYFLKSVYNGKICESLIFAVFSLKVISAIEASGIDLSESSRIYSKEIEHSANNLDNILKLFG